MIVVVAVVVVVVGFAPELLLSFSSLFSSELSKSCCNFRFDESLINR